MVTGKNYSLGETWQRPLADLKLSTDFAAECWLQAAGTNGKLQRISTDVEEFLSKD